MLKILSLLGLSIFFSMTVHAASYSCRTKQGNLYLTDNLQSLPAECRGEMRKVDPEDPDNLNYVPSQKVSPGVGFEFQKTVRDIELKREKKQQQIEGWLLRSKQLAEQYRQAIQEKNNATRRWSYKSRQIISEAEEQIAKTREGKLQVLAEMKRQKNLRNKQAEIVSWLDQIVD